MITNPFYIQMGELGEECVNNYINLMNKKQNNFSKLLNLLFNEI